MHSIETIDGDIYIKDGKTFEVDNLVDLEQCLLAIFSTRKGEFPLDIELGLDYKPFFDKMASDSERELALMEAAFQDDRVTAVNEINMELDKVNRRIKVSMEVISDYGRLQLEEVELYG